MQMKRENATCYDLFVQVKQCIHASRQSRHRSVRFEEMTSKNHTKPRSTWATHWQGVLPMWVSRMQNVLITWVKSVQDVLKRTVIFFKLQSKNQVNKLRLVESRPSILWIASILMVKRILEFTWEIIDWFWME